MTKPRSPWPIVHLDKVAKIQTGIAKGKTGLVNPVSIPYLRVANVQDGYFDLTEVKLIIVSEREVERYLLRQGDVVLTEGGDWDKLGRGAIWDGSIDPCLHQNHLFVVRPNSDVLLPEFLACLTTSRYGRKYFASCSKQSTNLASINSTQLRHFPVPLAPRNEQWALCSILRAADDEANNVTNILQAKRRLKQGLMQQLLTGRKRFPEFAGTEWKEYRLGELFRERVEAKRPGLTLLSITSDRGVILRSGLTRKDTSSEDKSKYLRVCPGDIAYNTMRMWQGVSALSSLEGIVSPAYTVVVPESQIDGEFAAYLFKLRLMVHKFWSYSQGLVSDTLNLKYANFARIRISIPNLEEQKLITGLLRACDDEIAVLEQQQLLLQKQKRGLMEQLLTGRIQLPAAEAVELV